ncbi:MAG: hypothetical protein JSV49_00805 [Thermoplasmata archaeon]|nr:MAG: hypothetical protein JSV49_00805 [Thermoplasmata archaeon]
MAVLLWMIYIETSQDGNGNGITPGELEAVIEVDNTQAYAGETLNFNAARSIGEISAYQWIFDTDFILTSGSDTSIYVGGYFAQTVAEKNEYTVSLTVETAEGQLDSDSISITINPLEVIVSEELLGDSGLFLSEGNITVTNPDNIASFSYNSGSEFFGVMDININNILLNFRNVTNDPMSTSIFDSPSQIASGFNNLHDVYIREIRQNLEISGSMDASMTSTTAGSYQETLPITGTMNSVETSYTDYTTGHTIQIHTTNDLDLDSEITEPVSIPLEMQSTDELTSFPDLRATPSRLRLADLSEDPIELGDRDTIIYDNVAYSWIAVSADQASGNPALKLEFHLDSGTLKDNNIDEFYMH